MGTYLVLELTTFSISSLFVLRLIISPNLFLSLINLSHSFWSAVLRISFLIAATMMSDLGLIQCASPEVKILVGLATGIFLVKDFFFCMVFYYFYFFNDGKLPGRGGEEA